MTSCTNIIYIQLLWKCINVRFWTITFKRHPLKLTTISWVNANDHNALNSLNSAEQWTNENMVKQLSTTTMITNDFVKRPVLTQGKNFLRTTSTKCLHCFKQLPDHVTKHENCGKYRKRENDVHIHYPKL